MRRRALSILALLAWACVASSPGAGAQKSWEPLLRAQGIKDERLIRAMEKVRRADFLPESMRPYEREDRPLPIGYEQTTSQPTLIAIMIDLMHLKPGCNVLEVGTGSGYQTALLAELCAHVSSIEIVAPLAERAAARLKELGYKNIDVKAGDGYLGWPKNAPFDGIVVSAAAPRVPAPLVAQLKAGGRMIVPVEERWHEELLIVVKQADGGYTSEKSLPVAFVPLTGDQAERDRHR